MTAGRHHRPSLPPRTRRPRWWALLAPIVVLAGIVAVLYPHHRHDSSPRSSPAAASADGAVRSPTVTRSATRARSATPARSAIPARSANSPRSTAAPAPVTPPSGLARRVAAASRYAVDHGMHASSVAVLDTSTGELVTAGDPDRQYPTASVVKTLIATRLLLDGRMSGSVAAQATLMITRSDNDAADALYKLVGQDALVPFIAAHYGIPGLGAPPAFPTFWGSTRITAAGLARFYDAVRHDPRVWPWLSHAMHHFQPTTTAGEPNNFGLAAAVPSAAVKNGWNEYRDKQHPRDAQINTTGFVADRWAVVILDEGPDSFYFVKGEAIAGAQAALLFPS